MFAERYHFSAPFPSVRIYYIEACATAAALIQEDSPTKKERREQMGASASILEKASEEQKAEITAEIEKLKAENVADEEIEKQLKEKYAELLKTVEGAAEVSDNIMETSPHEVSTSLLSFGLSLSRVYSSALFSCRRLPMNNIIIMMILSSISTQLGFC